jgi:hypothetical protein
MRSAFSAILSVLALSACSEYDLAKTETEDSFNQLPAAEVDILLVVDNSCSMAPYQAELAANFENFLTFFEEGDVDYHIGVITTTVVPVEYDPLYTCSQAQLNQIPEGGSLVNDTFITPETQNGASAFEELVSVGTCGNGNEMGLESAARSMSGLLQDGNFLRDSAFLSFIFVSDEEDQSPYAVNDYTNAFRGVKGIEERDSFNASALVVTNPDRCDASQLSAGGGTPGTRYIDVAEQNGGILGNICADSFDRVVTELSLATSRLTDTFYLTRRPDQTSLQVLVEGEVVECDSGRWTYQELSYNGEDDVPAIVFERSEMPRAGETILVRYNSGGGGEHLCDTEDAATTGGA